MATQGMKRLEALHVKKIGNRVDEIRGHIWTRLGEVQDISMAETAAHLTPAEASRLRFKSYPCSEPC